MKQKKNDKQKCMSKQLHSKNMIRVERKDEEKSDTFVHVVHGEYKKSMTTRACHGMITSKLL